jgi:hypothetical protein
MLVLGDEDNHEQCTAPLSWIGMTTVSAYLSLHWISSSFNGAPRCRIAWGHRWRRGSGWSAILYHGRVHRITSRARTIQVVKRIERIIETYGNLRVCFLFTTFCNHKPNFLPQRYTLLISWHSIKFKTIQRHMAERAWTWKSTQKKADAVWTKEHG